MSNPKCLALNIEPVAKKLEFLKKRMFFFESELLRCLEFNTSRVLAVDLLNYFAEDAGFDFSRKRYFYCLYLLNISYLSLKLRSHSQSLLAFAVVYFVNRIFSKDEEWPSTREESSPNLLKAASKKVAFLKLDARFKEWTEALQSFRAKHTSGLDGVTRIGETALPAFRAFQKEARFLSKFSNSVNEESRRQIAVELSEKENRCNLESVENSRQANFVGEPKTKSVFTAKNGEKCADENKSTGVSRGQRRSDFPNKKISAFDILSNKSHLQVRDFESVVDAGDTSTAKKNISYKEIKFDFSRVKSVALDVFNGTFSFRPLPFLWRRGSRYKVSRLGPIILERPMLTPSLQRVHPRQADEPERR